jgi:hypothetical protein
MRINRLLIAGIVSVGLLTSCANNEESDGGTSSPAIVKLTLSTGSTTKTGGGSTFTTTGNASTSTPTGTGTLASSGTDEAKINHICVGLFKTDGTTVSIQEVDLSSSSVSTSSNTAGELSTSITTTTDAQDVVIAANVPANKFKGVATKAAFIQTAADLAYTTSADGLTSTPTSLNKQYTTALPMYGAATGINAAKGSTPSVSIALTRMVSRVGIKAITTAFDASGAYSSATFVPTEVFMYNANTSCNWDGSFTPSVQTGESTTTPASSSSAITSANNSSLTNYAYLSSGYLDFSSITPNTATTSTLNSSTVYATSYLTSSNTPIFFYVFPNNNTAPTKLVIKGIWHFNGTYEIVYYPIIINHAQTGTTFTNGGTSSSSIATGSTDSYVATNTRYALTATIKAKGSSSPSTDITPATVSVTVSVTAWADTSQDVIFN